MKNRQIRKTCWLLAALAAPIAHFSGNGWPTAALMALVILPLSLLPGCWEGISKPIALIQILWLGVVAGSLLPAGAVYWPSDNNLAVPLTILALAACTRASAAPRIGAVLAFCMTLLTIPLAVSGAANLKLKWLSPESIDWSAGLATALLIPALPTGETGRKGRGLLGLGALAVLLGALVQGVLSAEAAGDMPDVFYQMSRTLGYLEPVTAVGMTLGWYALTILLLKSAGEIGKNSGLSCITAKVIPVGTAAGMLLFDVRPAGWIVPGLGLLFWILLPLLRCKKFFEKK